MKIRDFAWLAGVAFLAGCGGEGVTRQPPTDVAIYNAAANIETIGFYREESLEAQLAYAQGTVTSFDSGSYDFNVDYTLVGAQRPPRALTVQRTLASDRNYTFVVVAPGGDFNLIVAETEDRPAGADLVRWSMIHAFPGLGPLDVYVEPPDTILSSATPKGSVSYEGSTSFEFASGAYRVWLTAAGDPNDILFESLSLNLPNGADQTFVVSDPGDQGTLDIVVSRIGSTTLRLAQDGETSALRVVNVIEDRLDRDIYLDDTTAAPFLPSLPFGEIPDYQEIAVASHTVISTPVGNPGAEESTGTFFTGPGQRYTSLVWGDTTDGISQLLVPEDKRSISGQATLRIINGAGSFFIVQIYLVPPGVDIFTRAPILELGTPSTTDRVPLVPDDYDLWARDPITDTVLAGPVPITMADGGVYGILLADAEGGSTIDVILFDDFVL